MRRILPVAITFAALSLSTTGVRADGTWCAHYGTGLERMNCGFYSFALVDLQTTEPLINLRKQSRKHPSAPWSLL
jgi:hypothetical protein